MVQSDTDSISPIVEVIDRGRASLGDSGISDHGRAAHQLARSHSEKHHPDLAVSLKQLSPQSMIKTSESSRIPKKEYPRQP